jgi:hypothetical protein
MAAGKMSGAVDQAGRGLWADSGRMWIFFALPSWRCLKPAESQLPVPRWVSQHLLVTSQSLGAGLGAGVAHVQSVTLHF